MTEPVSGLNIERVKQPTPDKARYGTKDAWLRTPSRHKPQTVE